MGVTIATIQAAADTGGGNQDITTAKLGGLTPVAVFVRAVRATVNGTPSDNAVGSYGACDGTNQWVVAGASEHNVGTQDSHRFAATDELIVILDPTDGSIDGEANFNSFIADGVRITWGDTPAAAYLMTFIFFAGTDVSAAVGTAAFAAEDAATHIETVGFEPDVVIFGSDNSTFDAGTESYFYRSVGFALNNGTQRCFAFASDDGVGTANTAGGYTETYGVAECATAAFVYGGLVSGFDAAGFEVTTKLGSAGTDEFGWFALAFASAINLYGGTVNTPISTGNDTVTGVGFSSQAVILGLTQLTATGVVATGDAGSAGMSTSDATNQYCNSVQDEDGEATTDTQSLADDQIINFPNDDGSAAHVATLTTFDSDGWQWNFSVTEGTAVKWWALAFERVSTATAGKLVDSIRLKTLVHGALVGD